MTQDVTDECCVVSLSGGKDSTATALVAIERHGPENVRLVMADTGHEHPLTMDYVEYLRGRLGMPIDVVRADFSRQIAGKRTFIARNWEYMGVPLARIDRALELLHPTGNPFLDLCMWKGRFPSRMAQFCTQELKSIPLEAYILDIVAANAARLKGTGIDPQQRYNMVESWQGIRRDESRNRRDALEYEAACLDRPWAIVRPIVDWTAQRTVDYVRSCGVDLNPLYSQGMKRVGCMPCIHCGKDELNQIALRFPKEIDRVREWERLVGEVGKKATTFFSDPYIQGDGIKRDSSEYAKVDDVVSWAATSRGGTQFDLIRALPPETCSSLYGLCE